MMLKIMILITLLMMFSFFCMLIGFKLAKEKEEKEIDECRFNFQKQLDEAKKLGFELSWTKIEASNNSYPNFISPCTASIQTVSIPASCVLVGGER